MSTPKPLYALIDCNNFYASCEKLFRPDLDHRSVIVLSNNDGCVVARSKEAKALGIKMGEPAFKIEHIIERENIAVFSSNYAFYADISMRVMQTIEHHWPDMEIYSIDEAFLDLSRLPSTTSPTELCHSIRDAIYQWTGITVSIGIAPTKTLAKAANYAAKKYPATGGVVHLETQQRAQKLLQLMPVGEIWGIGPRTTAKLINMGMETAADLAGKDPLSMKKRFSVNVARTIEELQGNPCFHLEEDPAPRKQMVCSRSFGERITQKEAMAQAVSTYASRVTEKMREQNLQTNHVTVFLRTSPFNDSLPYYSNAASATIGAPSNDTREIIAMANQLLDYIWKDGYRYVKAGVMLSELTPASSRELGLWEDRQEYDKQQRLMAAIDSINHSGKGRVWFASEGASRKQEWKVKRERLSPSYTTDWSELPVVRL
ncbi:DNA-directed DNA polymerase [Desulfurispirillum indicum S5]|uniref:DNA-directed DNA polymerase n=1 Tax=Desulfurispirillum indicum (strain ATCC BAA-1389 / DSM 22839 / S5) TaxID=653733 RepID=E6W6Y3_DESIS|nr:translesion error-prone DNA polymerase V subunit UmuC [Desulfurispirillum indicum]ADU66226.1 DNA-directed DNA polymerase [Desulfurispirillum indicum S5]